ncbi:hypothetical protein [Alcaligenes ammonioxydans]|uniref:hypothetical protein n=1 Tax=Alcaligenes ammonioxydans TaxID=2582914 RepID=UPI003D239B31
MKPKETACHLPESSFGDAIPVPRAAETQHPIPHCSAPDWPAHHTHAPVARRARNQALMDQGRIERAAPHALACLIYRSLAETAFWVAQNEDDDARLAKGLAALDLRLRGLLLRS